MPCCLPPSLSFRLLSLATRTLEEPCSPRGPFVPSGTLPLTSSRFMASTAPKSTRAVCRPRGGLEPGGRAQPLGDSHSRKGRQDCLITSRLWVSAQALLPPVPGRRTPDREKGQRRVSWSRSGSLACVGKDWGVICLIFLFKF